jgi:acyl-CoA synthetase (AMP-forming)/AMP-acid ligase II
VPSAPVPSSPLSLLSCWQQRLEAAPQSPALIEAAHGRVYTRAEVADCTERWLRSFSAETLRGRRVAFALPNGLGWLTVFLGILRAGAVAVPLDPTEPAASQHQLARHAGAQFLAHDGGIEPVETDATAPGPDTADNRDLCLIKLTSGTTGVPRALAFTHAQMLADGEQVCRSMGIGPTDLNLAIVPFGHSYGLGNLVIPLLQQGTACVCVSAPLPHAIAADLHRWRATVFPAVPALLRVLTVSDLAPETFSSVRLVLSAGSPLTADAARAFLEKYGRRVHGFYGSSETGGITFDRTGDATLEGRSVGSPLEGVSVSVGEDQRFRVSSAAVFTHENPDRTAAGWGVHQPADRGAFNDRGELVLLGRAGRMMKIAGRRLDLAELETTLRQLPDIRDAYVAPHPQRPEELAALLATSLSLDEARSRLRRHLAPWKMPRRLSVLAEFPLTARGKPDTRALLELLGRGA